MRWKTQTSGSTTTRRSQVRCRFNSLNNRLVENADEEDDMEEDTTVLKDQDIAERLMIPEIDYQALDMIGRDGTSE